MLIEERERKQERLIAEEFSTIETLSNLDDVAFENFYNSCYREDEVEVDKVSELIVEVQEKLTDLFNDDLPMWIRNIPDEDIKKIAIDKYKVTPQQVLNLVDKLRQTYEQS